MELLAPWSLAGLVLVPAIFLWGLWAPRGRRVVVGSLLLWQRALGRGAVGRPSARVRLRNPLLWLDAASILLVVLACARPVIRTTAPAEPVASVVIDRTASMAIAGPGGPRWRRVLETAAFVFAGAEAAPIRLVSVPGPLGSVAAQRTNADRVFSQPVLAEGPVLVEDDVWPVAVAEAARQPDLPVLVLTDLPPESALPRNVYVIACGGESANAGLVRVATRIESDGWWLLVAAKAAKRALGPFGLRVEGDGRPLTEIPGFLHAAQDVERVLAMSGAPPKELHVALSGPLVTGAAASLEADDDAYLVLEEARRMRVLLVGEADPYLRRALAATRRVEILEHLETENVPVGVADLIIASGVRPPADWKGPAILVTPPEGAGPLRPTDDRVRAEWRVAAGHPLAQALYLAPPRIGPLRRYEVGDEVSLVCGTRHAPLIVTWPEQGAKRLAVLLSLEQEVTDWPEREGFPVFWSRAVDWLVPRPRGEAVHKTRRPFSAVPGESRLAPNRPGFHGEGGRRTGVSFIGSEEGFQAGTARDDSAAAAEAIKASVAARRRAACADLWPYLAAAALILLVARAWVAR